MHTFTPDTTLWSEKNPVLFIKKGFPPNGGQVHCGPPWVNIGPQDWLPKITFLHHDGDDLVSSASQRERGGEQEEEKR